MRKKKKCVECKKIKSLKEFYRHNLTKDRYSRKCKACYQSKGRPPLDENARILTDGGRKQRKSDDNRWKKESSFRQPILETTPKPIWENSRDQAIQEILDEVDREHPIP